MTFSGNYAGFTTLLTVVEEIEPAVRIDELRLYRRKRQGGVWLSLTLSMMTKTDAGASIAMPTVDRLAVTPDPFDNMSLDLKLQPSREQENALPQLIGILWDDNNPIAILSHDYRRHLAQVGAVVAGTTIVSIELKQVIIKRSKRQYLLKLWTPREEIQLK